MPFVDNFLHNDDSKLQNLDCPYESKIKMQINPDKYEK